MVKSTETKKVNKIDVMKKVKFELSTFWGFKGKKYSVMVSLIFGYF